MGIYVANLLDDLDRLSTDPLELTAFELWILMSAAQSAWRNPRIGKELRRELYKLGHLIQRQFDGAPALAILAETGWYTSMDVPALEKGE